MLTYLKNLCCVAACAVLVPGLAVRPAAAQEIVVFGGVDDVVDWMQAENWWGQEQHGAQLRVPKAIITGISERWRETANKMPVPEKKEIFYRFMLPLAGGSELSDADLAWLRKVAVLLRITDDDGAAALGESSAEIQDVIGVALHRLDVIPAGLALGQAAYESGYGTSRFAVQGNALFGQWTFGGEGLVPEQQRGNLGDHRIAAFEWPFDSVRGYFLNLSSHPAYEELRRLRAELKAAGKPVTSLVLADGLIRYSERGQAYVDTLKGIIRVNKLDIADDAVFRDEPMRYVVPAEDQADAVKLREEIGALRESGELEKIIARMQLE